MLVGACVVAAAGALANAYAWGRAVAELVRGPRARMAAAARAGRNHSVTLALRPEVQALTHVVS